MRCPDHLKEMKADVDDIARTKQIGIFHGYSRSSRLASNPNDKDSPELSHFLNVNLSCINDDEQVQVCMHMYIYLHRYIHTHVTIAYVYICISMCPKSQVRYACTCLCMAIYMSTHIYTSGSA